MTKDLSIIIPTLNAAPFLPATLASLSDCAEIIVADGGSIDGTREIATAQGARVLTAPRGRGIQLATGIAAATRPWLLLLHADTRLSPNWRTAIHATFLDRLGPVPVTQCHCIDP